MKTSATSRSEHTELTGGLTQVFGQWQQVMFLQLNDESTIFPDGRSDSALLLIPGISYASLPPNFLTGWVRDAAYYVELSGSPATLGSDASYLRLLRPGRAGLADQGPWYVRGRAGTRHQLVDNFSELPASQRFFAGGDRSVRGFGAQLMSPPLPPSDVKGAGSSVRARAAAASTKSSPASNSSATSRATSAAPCSSTPAMPSMTGATPLEYSVGLGVRWKLPMLMIGLDVAQALSQSDLKPRLHLNITQVL